MRLALPPKPARHNFHKARPVPAFLGGSTHPKISLSRAEWPKDRMVNQPKSKNQKALTGTAPAGRVSARHQPEIEERAGHS